MMHAFKKALSIGGKSERKIKTQNLVTKATNGIRLGEKSAKLKRSDLHIRQIALGIKEVQVKSMGATRMLVRFIQELQSEP